MDLTSIVIPTVVIILLVQVGKDLIGVVSARWGALVAQLTLLIAAFAVAGVGAFFQILPPHIVDGTIKLFSAAMVVYEVFYKAIYQGAILGGKKN